MNERQVVDAVRNYIDGLKPNVKDLESMVCISIDQRGTKDNQLRLVHDNNPWDDSSTPQHFLVTIDSEPKNVVITDEMVYDVMGPLDEPIYVRAGDFTLNELLGRYCPLGVNCQEKGTRSECMECFEDMGIVKLV